MWRFEIWRATGIGIVVCVLAQWGTAEEVTPSGELPKEKLPELAIAAKEHFHPITQQNVNERKADVVQAMKELEEFWRRDDAEQADQAEKWHQFLRWDELQKELAKDEPDPRQIQELRNIYLQMQPGLELPAYCQVRDALTRYLDGLLVIRQPKLEELYHARLDDLAERLRAYQEAPNKADAIAIGRTLGWLEQAGQAEELVARIRRQYRQPNFMAQLSERIMAAGFAEEVSEVAPVRDTILGTSIRGTADMNGEIGMELVPDSDRAALDILLKGNAYSRNVGYNGPVTIRSTGTTWFSATKRVYIDASGFGSLNAIARCRTASRISCIAAKSCLVRKIAQKRAAKTKGQAERVASSHSAGQIQRQFDDRAAEMLDEANESYSKQFESPLIRRDSFPNQLQFSTTEDHLCLELMRAGMFQLAPGGTPPSLSGDHDVAIRLHESLVSNFSETLIGGETLTDEKLVKLLQEAKMEIPDELKIGPEKDPWSITFSRDEPVNVQFSDHQVRVAIKGRQFSRGDQVIRATVEISAVYQLEMGPKGAKVTRQGDVEVDFVGRSRLSVAQVAMKTFLRRKFDSLFEQDLSGEGLQLPGRWQRAGRLMIRQLDSENGWLALGWSSKPADAPVADQDAATAEMQVAASDTP